MDDLEKIHRNEPCVLYTKDTRRLSAYESLSVRHWVFVVVEHSY